MKDKIELLSTINEFNYHGEFQLPSTLLQNVCRNYAKFIKELFRNGLIYVIWSYSTDKHYCRQYHITAKGLKVLNDFWSDQLRKITTKEERRKIQKRDSERGHFKQTFDDISLQSQQDLLNGIEVDWNKLNPIIDSFSVPKAVISKRLLVHIFSHHWETLEKNSNDNRIHTFYSNLPTELKPHLKINGVDYFKTIDIRSCHISLFGEHIRRTQGRRENQDHQCYVISDILELTDEVNRYNSILLNPDIDPKEYLSRVTKIPRNKVKEVSIKLINGKGFKETGPKGRRVLVRDKDGNCIFTKKNGDFYRMNEWMKRGFPTMYREWIATDIKRTGCLISKHFETKVIQDPRVYQKAKELGYILGNEHDGVSIYSNNRSESDFASFLEFMEGLSVGLLDGIRLIFVDKTAPTLDFMEQVREIRKETLEDLKDKERDLRKRFQRNRSPFVEYSWEESKRVVVEYIKLNQHFLQDTI